MIHTTTSKQEAAKYLIDYLLDPLVVHELGEPILFRQNDVFGFYEGDLQSEPIQTKAFFCVSINDSAFLRYIYVNPIFRGQGLFNVLIKSVEDLCVEAGCSCIKAVATNSALPLYLAKGYKITKSYVNYHKIQKDLI